MRILFATDFCDDAKHALQLLVRIHLLPSSEVTLLHVVGRTPDFSRAARDKTTLRKFVDRLASEGEERLTHDADWLHGQGGAVTTIVREGHIADEICRAASELKTELVVLGARGLSGIQRFFLGSVSEKVAKYAPCSVLIGRAHGQLPDKMSADEFKTSGPLTLVVGSDGSAASDDAVRTIASLPPAASEPPLFLVTTITHTHKTLLFEEPGMERMWQDERMAAEEVLGRSISRLEESGYHVIPELGEGDPADEILRAAEANNADLIVIGSTGHSGIKRFLLGSVSDRVLRHAKCSVWVHRQR